MSYKHIKYKCIKRKLKNGGSFMITTENIKRYCTVCESLIESCKEVKLMREGKTEKPNLKSLWDNIEKYKKEVKE